MCTYICIYIWKFIYLFSKFIHLLLLFCIDLHTFLMHKQSNISYIWLSSQLYTINYLDCLCLINFIWLFIFDSFLGNPPKNPQFTPQLKHPSKGPGYMFLYRGLSKTSFHLQAGGRENYCVFNRACASCVALTPCAYVIHVCHWLCKDVDTPKQLSCFVSVLPQ